MKMKLMTIGVLLVTTVFVSSVEGFERIKNSKDALSKELGVIHLIGENHYFQLDIDQKTLLKKFAKQGKIILGKEAYKQEMGRELNDTLFGIEDSILYITAGALVNIYDCLRHMEYKRRLEISAPLTKYSDAFPRNIMKETLESLCHYFSMSNTKADPKEISFVQAQFKRQNPVLLALVKSTEEDAPGTLDGSASIYKHIGKNSFDDNFYDNLSIDTYDWFVLLKQAAQYFIDHCTVDTTEIQETLFKLMNCYEEIVKSKDINKLNQIYKNFGTLGSEVEYVRINLRDNVFLYNICRGYEEKKHLKKPFFILVGSNHVPFLKLNLRAQGYVVKVRDDNHGEKSEL